MPSDWRAMRHWLKLRRLDQRMTQQQLARVVDRSLRTVSDWERGVNIPSAVSLILWCQALGISIIFDHHPNPGGDDED